MRHFFSKIETTVVVLILIGGFLLGFADLLEARAQEGPVQKKEKWPPPKHYTVGATRGEIKIDGKLEEGAWAQAVKIDLPYEWYPGNNTPAAVGTECLMTFDKTHLYIAFRCLDPRPRKIRAHFMNRDKASTFLRDDHVTVLIDSFNDERRAFEFRVNPLGVQMDGIYNELEGADDFSWDAIWKSAGRVTDFGYVVEFSIPFNQLRFPRDKGEQTWGFSFYRFYPREVPYRMSSHPVDWDRSCSLCQSHKIDGFRGMWPGRNLEFDPTLTLNRTDQRGNAPGGAMERGKEDVEIGLSGRWGITPSLALNGAVNPDFSHVEADVAQLEINTRFALYYPEKRPFFLEGTDYFKTPLEAVFTRTVFDPAWGIKLTGRAGRDAFGFFLTEDRFNRLLFPSNQQSDSTAVEEAVLGGVFRYRKNLGRGSTLGFLYTGRGSDEYRNQVLGADAFVRLSRTKFLNFQFLRSGTRYAPDMARDFGQPTGCFDGNALFFNFRHNSRRWYYGFDYQNISADFRADFGFLPRVDVETMAGFVEPVWWGKPGGWFNLLSLRLKGEQVRDREGQLTDRSFGVEAQYHGPMQIRVMPSFYFQEEFYRGVTYDKNVFKLFFDTRPAKGWMFYLLTRVGDAIDYANSRPGDGFFFETGLNLALGRSLNIDLLNTFERLSAAGQDIYRANLLQSRIVYNFNPRTFVRVILQYTDINRNTDLYTFPIEAETRLLFTQLLFSYKLNPRTVLFLGYSDNHLGAEGIDLFRKDRTFFLKIGYALVL